MGGAMLRSELHALLWAQSVVSVAPRFGMSDRGLAKLCARHNIPLPERGYWAKIAGGKYPARMPLPRADQDYQIPLKELVVNADTLPSANLQATMSRLFEVAPDLGEADQEQPEINNDPAPEQEAGTQPVEHEVKRKRGRPRKQAGMPADADQRPSVIPTTGVDPGPLASAKKLPPVPQSGPATVSLMLPTELMALEAECQRAMAAGMEYQRRQAAQAFLGAVVASAYSLDEPTSTAVLRWARAVQKRLALLDPVAAVISEIHTLHASEARK